MNSQEKKSIISLALLFSFRMLGLFLILPVFSLYAQTLLHSTPALIGIALGVYGLTQAIFQMPLAILSDKFGRKPIIVTGLLLFAFGSIVAAVSHTIEGVIIGRALQGTGAIGSTILAYAADLTREEYRTKAMAIIGMTIGFSFSLAMALSPLMNSWIGVSGIFWLTASLAILGLFLLFKGISTPTANRMHSENVLTPKQLWLVLRQPALLRLDFSIFSIHAILTAIFIVVPIMLKNFTGIPLNKQWIIYLPVIVLSFIAMFPFIILAEKKQQMKRVFVGAVICLFIAQIMIFTGQSYEWMIAFGLFIFFTAFTLLEALLPSLISKIAPPSHKGTAIGFYSTCQFLGIFVGGVLGGWFYGQYQVLGVFIFCGILTLIWLAIARGLTTIRSIK
jgi:predicted MFS family arabinose efflux permease